MKPSVAFIFVTVAIDMMGIGLIIPSLPDIMRRFLTDERAVSEYFGYFVSIYALMQFLASPLLGAISDRVGRRVILLVSLFIAGLDYLVMAFAPSLVVLFLGRIISGLTGANITVAMAYIADVSTDENRSRNFGLIGAAFGLGFVIGPAIGGLLGGYGAHYPFVVAASLNLLNFLFGLYVLPESLPMEARRNVDFSRINPFSSITKVFSISGVAPLVVIYFLFHLAGDTHPSIWTLYTETRFGWTVGQVGFSLAVVGVLSAIAQGWLTGRVVARWGEERVVIIGCLGFILAFVGFASATEGWMMYAVLLFSSLFWTSQPALQSLISREVPTNQQGELQGSLMSFASLAAILNPLIVTQLFAYFNHHPHFPVPGAPYFFAALVSVGALIVAFYNLKLRKV